MKLLNHLDIANDITLLEFTFPRTQAQLTSTAAAAKDLGLIISVTKTKYMTHPHLTHQVYGESINHVTDFRYLISKASASNDSKRRKTLRWSAFLEAGTPGGKSPIVNL